MSGDSCTPMAHARFVGCQDLWSTAIRGWQWLFGSPRITGGKNWPCPDQSSLQQITMHNGVTTCQWEEVINPENSSHLFFFFSYLRHPPGCHGWIENKKTQDAKNWQPGCASIRDEPGTSTETLGRKVAAAPPPPWWFCSTFTDTWSVMEKSRERECKNLAALPGLNACTGQQDLCWEEMSVSESLIMVMRLFLHWHASCSISALSLLLF